MRKGRKAHRQLQVEAELGESSGGEKGTDSQVIQDAQEAPESAAHDSSQCLGSAGSRCLYLQSLYAASGVG